MLPGFLSWLTPAVTAIGNLGPGYAALAGLGAAYVIDPDTASSVVERIGDGASQMLGDVSEVAGSAIGSTVGGFISGSGILGPVLLIGGGYIVYKILTSDNDEKETSNA